MVAGRHELIPLSGGTIYDEQCMSIGQVLEPATHNQLSIALTLSLVRSDLDKEETNIRVGKEPHIQVSTGCTGEKSAMPVEVMVALPCPDEATSRCANCLLRLAAGEPIHDQIVASRQPERTFWT